MTKTEEGFALLISFLGVPSYFGYVADYRRESEKDLPSIASRARGTLTQPFRIVIFDANQGQKIDDTADAPHSIGG
jgi:hypothetical protein